MQNCGLRIAMIQNSLLLIMLAIGSWTCKETPDTVYCQNGCRSTLQGQLFNTYKYAQRQHQEILL